MSKSGMLRTRRRDVNVKPNRRLDRKSSRGMIYENEELRLRTININAEIERGQSDIKKLRRENEQLRKEIWCLRDEYEKLDKLLKDKSQEDSCSSCTSDITDSCSSCSDSEDNETTQNIENVHKTAVNGLRAEFDHLSVVTEETSAENSDKNSNSAASPPDHAWNAIQPDQSYPIPSAGHAPTHFFSPLRTSRSVENCCDNTTVHASSWSLGPAQLSGPLQTASPTYATSLLPCEKTSTDVLVKTDGGCDFPNYTQRSTNSSFTNGGNLDELLQDIQTISNDILQISAQNQLDGTQPPEIKFEAYDEENAGADESDLKPYKSELNVVLVPQPMPLLGFDKYQGLLSSRESLETIRKSSEQLGNVSPSLHRLSPVPPSLTVPVQEDKPQESCCLQTTPPFPTFPSDLLGFTPSTTPLPPELSHPDLAQQSNPFFYYENYQSADSQNIRYGAEKFAHDNLAFKSDLGQHKSEKEDAKAHGKSNADNETIESTTTRSSALLKSSTTSSDLEHKMEKSENEKNDDRKESNKKEETQKSPIARRTRKVSIYFKGKKDKFTRSLSLDTKLPGKLFEHAATPRPSGDKSPLPEKKTTKVTSSPKTERKTSTVVPRSPGHDGKTTPFDTTKIEQSDKNLPSDGKTSTDSKTSNSDRKHRKSSSTSPERKHAHGKTDDGKKCHKKRHRKLSNNRSSLSVDKARERSFSVCTDRSNILEHRFGHFDDLTNSERDRSNSISSCDTIKSRKLSNLPNLSSGGKIPWFGCWGNGCL